MRGWDDRGAALGDLVAVAGRACGPAGDRAVRLGLETVGAGLGPTDPDGWTVDREIVAAVSPALGEAVAAHVEVAAGALSALAAEGGNAGAEDRVRGLGVLSVDRRAAATVEGALAEWAARQSYDLAGSSRADPLPAVAVPAAYVAAQEHGQRLDHALDGFELQEEAQNRERLWNWTAGLLLDVASYSPVPAVAVVADVVGAYAPLLLDVDGTFEQGQDRGLRFGADDAVAQALATLPPEATGRAAAVEAQAEAAYRRTADQLGAPEVPVSAERDVVDATLDLVTDGLIDLAEDERRDRSGHHRRWDVVSGLLPGRR
jgi:hypothetical protein